MAMNHFVSIDIRLNEGHTVYLERMICRCMFEEQSRQFVALGGWKDLLEAVSTLFVIVILVDARCCTLYQVIFLCFSVFCIVQM